MVYSAFEYDAKGNMIKEFFANYYMNMSDITFDFTNEDQVHYLTHEICHLVKGYNRC